MTRATDAGAAQVTATLPAVISITEALGFAPDVPERFAHILDAERHVVDLPNDADKVKDYIIDSIQSTDV